MRNEELLEKVLKGQEECENILKDLASKKDLVEGFNKDFTDARINSIYENFLQEKEIFMEINDKLSGWQMKFEQLIKDKKKMNLQIIGMSILLFIVLIFVFSTLSNIGFPLNLLFILVGIGDIVAGTKIILDNGKINRNFLKSITRQEKVLNCQLEDSYVKIKELLSQIEEEEKKYYSSIKICSVKKNFFEEKEIQKEKRIEHEETVGKKLIKKR